jgi:putative flavoprotein involved in K+ transport
MRISRSAGRWVARDDFVDYLERYAAHHRIEVQFETRVERIDRGPGGWTVSTSRGTIEAPHVVVATGFDCEPYLPRWPGLDRSRIPVVHSSEYRNSSAYRDLDVLVVGAGSSGTEIALDLAEAGVRVTLAVRTPPLLLAREWIGIPVSVFSLLARLSTRSLRDFSAGLLSRAMCGDLSPYGIERSRDRLSEMIARGRLPTVDTGFVTALRHRRIRVVDAVERFDRSAVVLADGSRASPDRVIAATAYRGGLEPTIGHLGIVGADGRPRLDGDCCDSSVPGLWFVGFHTALTGHLPPIRRDARKVARSLSRAARTARPAVAQQPRTRARIAVG